MYGVAQNGPCELGLKMALLVPLIIPRVRLHALAYETTKTSRLQHLFL